MTSISPLNSVHLVGDHGNFKNKNSDEIINIKELKNFKIFQIVKFKKNKKNINDYKLSGLDFPDKLKVSENNDVRILWIGPNNWLVFSSVLDLLEKEKNQFNETEFAITDISHSRTIIELEGNLVNEVLKKGCPLDINSFKEGKCANSVYNGINITIDIISDNPKKVRVLGLRSFGESLYHSITDACLEFGYKTL